EAVMARLVSTLDRLSCWSTALLRVVHFSVILACPQRSQMGSIEVQYSFDGEQYTMLRLGYLTPVETVSVGVMCACPEGNGFPMTFEGFKIRSL
nr:DUF1349 domain-containing protein [Symplocastrum torsivum CPER-KK1]